MDDQGNIIELFDSIDTALKAYQSHLPSLQGNHSLGAIATTHEIRNSFAHGPNRQFGPRGWNVK